MEYKNQIPKNSDIWLNENKKFDVKIYYKLINWDHQEEKSISENRYTFFFLINGFMLTKIDPRKTTLLEMRIAWLFLDARS